MQSELLNVKVSGSALFFILCSKCVTLEWRCLQFISIHTLHSSLSLHCALTESWMLKALQTSISSYTYLCLSKRFHGTYWYCVTHYCASWGRALIRTLALCGWDLCIISIGGLGGMLCWNKISVLEAQKTILGLWMNSESRFAKISHYTQLFVVVNNPTSFNLRLSESKLVWSMFNDVCCFHLPGSDLNAVQAINEQKLLQHWGILC